MGGEIKLTEKEKWAMYFSSILKHAGFGDAAKYLGKIANKKHYPIDEFPVALETPNVYKAIRDAEKELNAIPKKTIQKKTLKMTLMEDIHGGKEDENV